MSRDGEDIRLRMYPAPGVNLTRVYVSARFPNLSLCIGDVFHQKTQRRRRSGG